MNKSLNVVLSLVGLIIMAMGINVGFGGIPTLGWFASNEFTVVADAQVYDVNDNHTRFLGGVWFGVGVVFLCGAVKLAMMRQTLITLCLMIALAGLFRFSAMDMGLVFSAAILPSLMLEVIGFPLLAVWLWRNGR